MTISRFCRGPRRFSERRIYSASPLAGAVAPNLFMRFAVPELKRTEVRATLWLPLPLTEPLKHDADVCCAHFNPDGQKVVMASSGIARVWDANKGQPLTE